MATTGVKMAVYSVKLNGKARFRSVDGDLVRWQGREIDYLFEHDSSSSPLKGTWNLEGRNWHIGHISVSAKKGGTARFFDRDSKSGRDIDVLDLAVDSVVRLKSTSIDYLIGRSRADEHNVALGGADTKAVDLNAEINVVKTGAGYVGSISTGGEDKVIVGAGGAGLISTGNRDDTVKTKGGFVTTIATGKGNDNVTIGNGDAETVATGSGRDVITAKGGVSYINAGGGNDEVYLGADGAGVVQLQNGNDRVVLSELAQPKHGVVLLGNDGIDTISFANFSVGVTIDLADTGWQDPGATSVGLFQLRNFENVVGSDQADNLIGNAKDNKFTGNAGADVFTFTGTVKDPESGTDTVRDFEDGTDLLRLPGQVFGALVIEDEGANLKITHDDGVILLNGMAGVTLDASDFLFV